jgi:hypothetical protein
MLDQWKRRRFRQKVEAAIEKLDRDRREAIYTLSEDILTERLETGYQHIGDKVKHTVDLLSTSAGTGNSLRAE